MLPVLARAQHVSPPGPRTGSAYKFAFGWKHKPPPIKIMDKFIINCGLKNTFRLTTNPQSERSDVYASKAARAELDCKI